jgi:hypothetical protein
MTTVPFDKLVTFTHLALNTVLLAVVNGMVLDFNVVDSIIRLAPLQIKISPGRGGNIMENLFPFDQQFFWHLLFLILWQRGAILKLHPGRCYLLPLILWLGVAGI